MVTFQKSLAAALVTGAVALMAPMLVHAQAAKTTNSNGASTAAGANAAGAASTSSGQSLTTNGTNAGANAAGAASTSSGEKLAPNATSPGAYGGTGTETNSAINNDVNKSKKKATPPATSAPNKMSSPGMTTQPH
jgi:hypothetical protein